METRIAGYRSRMNMPARDIDCGDVDVLSGDTLVDGHTIPTAKACNSESGQRKV